MAKQHGTRQQKRAAKQKAKRAEKRSAQQRRFSIDPTIRLQQAHTWPVIGAYAGSKLWEQGIGYLFIVRQEPGGGVVFASFVVDVYCLGVKDCFWHAGTQRDFRTLLEKTGTVQVMKPIAPACLVKIIKGAVDYAQSFGFPPHPDYEHAAMLLEGIDPSVCTEQFTYGREGKPYYIQGPYDSFVKAAAIQQRVSAEGGHFLVLVPRSDDEEFPTLPADADEFKMVARDRFEEEL